MSELDTTLRKHGHVTCLAYVAGVAAIRLPLTVRECLVSEDVS